jgi:hypothetical protein
MGLVGRHRHTKAALTKKQAKARLAWGKAHQGIHIDIHKTTVYSDESRINLWGSDGEQWCRRRPGEANLARNLKTTKQQGGGGLMVWGCISHEGVGRLYRVTDTMTAIQYCKVLEEELIPSIRDAGMDEWSITFQQDNARVHTARVTQAKMDELGLNLMPWPPASPDQNIIEHVWAILKDRIRKRKCKPTNLDQLWAVTQEEWYAIPKEQITVLYDSVPRRIDALVDAKGWYTKY